MITEEAYKILKETLEKNDEMLARQIRGHFRQRRSSVGQPRRKSLARSRVKIQKAAAGLTFTIRLQPRARRNAIIGELGEALKVALSGPAVDGRVNETCIEFLSEMLDDSIKLAEGVQWFFQ